MKKNALVVGGSNGIGLALVNCLLKKGYDKVTILDKATPQIKDKKIEYIYFDLTNYDDDIFKKLQMIDTLIITAGFGRITPFENITRKEIENSFKVNSVAIINIIKEYYNKLLSEECFDCLVMGSIAGLVSSPLFALYGATKAAVCSFVESINIELSKKGTLNRVLNVSPGSIRGTKFNGGENDLSLLESLADEIIEKMNMKEELFIPDYEKTYKRVIENYLNNAHQFGMESYDYKMNSGRINNSPQIKVGYLSGTFDLFHIGHLNLLRRAKQYCDYLIVGVHKDASHKGKNTFIPFEERVDIVQNIEYVDKVIPSKPEDIDVYEEIKYDYLFVGSDYKGTDRFNRYEEFFKDTNVKIIYFPYTKGTSSTQLRIAMQNLNKEEDKRG